MGDDFCFSCGKKFGRLALKFDMNSIKGKGDLPNGMDKKDHICSSCFNLASQGLSLDYEKISRDRQNDESVQLNDRAGTYLDKLNKYGVLVFKNDRIAIAHRTEGNIGTFMIVFDDLTQEGYELKSVEDIIEQTQAGQDHKTGAYIYFQKINL